MLRRENVRLQVAAASATSAGDDLMSLRRQLRELTVAQDEARAQMEVLSLSRAQARANAHARSLVHVRSLTLALSL